MSPCRGRSHAGSVLPPTRGLGDRRIRTGQEHSLPEGGAMALAVMASHKEHPLAPGPGRGSHSVEVRASDPHHNAEEGRDRRARASKAAVEGCEGHGDPLCGERLPTGGGLGAEGGHSEMHVRPRATPGCRATLPEAGEARPTAQVGSEARQGPAERGWRLGQSPGGWPVERERVSGQPRQLRGAEADSPRSHGVYVHVGREADSERASTPTGDLRHQGLAGWRHSECCGTRDVLNQRAASPAVRHGEAMQGGQARRVEPRTGRQEPGKDRDECGTLQGRRGGGDGASRTAPRARAAWAQAAARPALAEADSDSDACELERLNVTPMKPSHRRRSHESGAQGAGWASDTTRGAAAKAGV